jgi:hypothetical protein
MPDLTDPADWSGRTLRDRNDDKIGTIDAVYVDEDSDRPEWALVNTGLFGRKSSFVPLAGASASGEDVIAQVEAVQVKDSPRMDADAELSDGQEAELFRHYGAAYRPQAPAAATTNGHTTGDRPRAGR